MCTRFELKLNPKELESYFEKYFIAILVNHLGDKTYATRNVSPTNPIAIIKHDGDGYYLDALRWGFKLASRPSPMINSKIESIITGKTTPYWQALMDNNPCLIAMTGFYEWKDVGAKKKEPYKSTLKNEELFFAAGYTRKEKDDDERVIMITTNGNDITRSIHVKDRMPVLLNNSTTSDFLTGDLETKDQASQYLNLKKSYLYKLTHQNKIPYYKPNGKKVFFKQSELNDWLFRNRIKSKNEIKDLAISSVNGGGSR